MRAGPTEPCPGARPYAAQPAPSESAHPGRSAQPPSKLRARAAVRLATTNRAATWLAADGNLNFTPCNVLGGVRMVLASVGGDPVVGGGGPDEDCDEEELDDKDHSVVLHQPLVEGAHGLVRRQVALDRDVQRRHHPEPGFARMVHR